MSKNAMQLAGKEVKASNLDRDCSPILYLKDVKEAMNKT